ncbi:MAG: DUF3240 family protein [Gammaproteobacteria bacterium]
MNECLLVIIATPTIEDALVDWLLTREGMNGFTSLKIDGHGTGHQCLSIAEQVTGRSRKLMFQCHLPIEVARDIIEGLKRDFAGSGLHYWMVPVLEAGRLE